MRAQQAGFTLIELVVVIVVLGILVATAMPRLTSIDVSSKRAVVQGGIAAIQSSAALSYSVNKTTTQLASILSSTSISDPLFMVTDSAGVSLVLTSTTCTNGLANNDSAIFAAYKDPVTSILIPGTLVSAAIDSALCSG